VVFVVDEDLNRVGEFVFVAHGGSRGLADGVEDGKVKEVESASFQHVGEAGGAYASRGMPGFFDNAPDGAVVAQDDGEVSFYGFGVGFFFDGDYGGGLMLFHFGDHGVEIGEFEEDIAEEKHEGAVDVGFELSDGVGDSELFLLFDVADVDAEWRAVAQGFDDPVSEMSDDDDDVLDADLAHVFELVGEQGFVGDGDDGFWKEVAEGSHARALARRQNHSLVWWFRTHENLCLERVFCGCSVSGRGSW